MMMATQTEQVVQATEPEPTETSEPDWVVNFSNPILSYIADRPPTFQDDFESGTLDSWALFTSGHSNPLNPYVENGQIHVSREQTYPRGFQFDDYVIEVDAKFAETVTPNNLNISFRTNNCVFRIYSDSYVDAYCYENPGGDTKIGKLSMGIDDLSDGRLVHLTLIVKDTRFAFFVDGIPLGFIDHEYLDFGNAMLSAEVPYGIFDNFQVWDISDFYIP
ncbi:MAG: hypothetical protein H0S79_17325 [Anaerolineaceae bacterium]|nr:hypothetical protein [Anaerolineaceae bacterium]